MARALSSSLAARLEERSVRATRRAWPCGDYQNDIVSFASEVLGRELWDEQAQWVQACAAPDARVSVVSGHKTGKTLGESVVALWAWSTFDPVRVFLFAPKLEHIKDVALWKEIRALYCNSGRCASCRAREHARCSHSAGVWKCVVQEPCARCSPIGPAEGWNDDPTTGLCSPDGRRELLAYTARDVDALGGLSGSKMVFIFDEAGGIKPAFFEAMQGNSAGGVTWVMAGNPLHTSGEQYDAHHGKRKFYTHVQEISSASTPNVKHGLKLVPGLATREWVELRAEDWGRESSAFMIRVDGKFPKYDPGQLLRVDEIAASNDRWSRMTFKGRLQIGVDVGFTGDEAAIAPRRGDKINEIIRLRDTNPDALAKAVADLAEDLKERHEQKPLVRYDAQGKTGRDFGLALQAYAAELEIVPIYGNAKPRDGKRFYMRRDELAAGFAAWVKRGGALPPDAKLEGELGATVSRPVSATDRRMRVPTNEQIKAIIGRSPDSRNACEYSCADARTEGLAESPEAPLPEKAKRRAANDDGGGEERVKIGPYGAADAGMLRAWGEP